MFLAYVDASGCLTDGENYVLASIITHESNWRLIDNAVNMIKVKHFPTLSPAEVEFHAKDMLNLEGAFKLSKWDEVYAIFDDIFDFLGADTTEIAIIAVIINKQKFYSGKDPQLWAYRLLFERINTFIERQNMKFIEAGHASEYGIMVTDSEGLVEDQKLRKKLFGMLRTGTHYSSLSWLIEDQLFTDSKWRNLSQMVDCVAYCVRKYFRQNTPSFHTTHWESYFKKIEPKLDAPKGRYWGIGIKMFPS